MSEAGTVNLNQNLEILQFPDSRRSERSVRSYSDDSDEKSSSMREHRQSEIEIESLPNLDKAVSVTAEDQKMGPDFLPISDQSDKEIKNLDIVFFRVKPEENRRTTKLI